MFPDFGRAIEALIVAFLIAAVLVVVLAGTLIWMVTT